MMPRNSKDFASTRYECANICPFNVTPRDL
uniref:Uncharacterized protein n=1 Tax=viral metagenome TaxID=1070528 RepID=A0A6C0C663_9ZZZZ